MLNIINGGNDVNGNDNGWFQGGGLNNWSADDITLYWM